MGNKKRFGCFMFLGCRCRKFVSERHLALFVLNSWMSFSPQAVFWWFYFMLIEGHLATIPALFPKSGYLLQTNDATFAKCHITSFASAKLTFFRQKCSKRQYVASTTLSSFSFWWNMIVEWLCTLYPLWANEDIFLFFEWSTCSSYGCQLNS